MVRGSGFTGVFSIMGVAALSALLGVSGCSSSDGGSGGGYCATWTQKLRDCGALGAGRMNCADYHDPAEVCETECVGKASCADVVLAFCSGSNENALYICMAQCIGEAPVTCNGMKLAGYVRCDGSMSCTNGADEDGCATTGMKCRNSEQHVPQEKRCDGIRDCSDGSDEYTADCATVKTCLSNGAMSSLNQYAVCDGFTECDDGSDEPADCAPHLCSKAQN